MLLLKSMISQLSNALSTVLVTFLDPKISFHQFALYLGNILKFTQYGVIYPNILRISGNLFLDLKKLQEWSIVRLKAGTAYFSTILFWVTSGQQMLPKWYICQTCQNAIFQKNPIFQLFPEG